MKHLKALVPLLVICSLIESCKKENKTETGYVYYEVGFDGTTPDWRDTSFIIRTKNPQLIQQAENQLALPVAQRKLVFGNLLPGSGGYNKNASYEFKWHFKEDDWSFVQMTVEIYDGRPYSDLDLDIDYWLNTVKRFASWGSYVRRRIN